MPAPSGDDAEQRFALELEGRGPCSAANGASPLPCLSSNICNENVKELSPYHRKAAAVLAGEIGALAKEFGLERLGFLTLTFADHVTEIKEAQKRFHSLVTGVLNPRYSRAIGVWERQESGRIHYHLLVVLGADIRSGCDFEAIEREDYRSANKALRSEWAFWRRTAPRYRFGRTELLPIKSTVDGISRYVGKYISKQIVGRCEADKGAKLVRYIGFKPGDRKWGIRFAWATDNSRLWRQKLARFADLAGCKSMEQLTEKFGRHWAFIFADTIMAIDLDDTTRPEPMRPAAELSDERLPRWAGEALEVKPASVKLCDWWRMREMRLWALRMEAISVPNLSYG